MYSSAVHFLATFLSFGMIPLCTACVAAAYFETAVPPLVGFAGLTLTTFLELKALLVLAAATFGFDPSTVADLTGGFRVIDDELGSVLELGNDANLTGTAFDFLLGSDTASLGETTCVIDSDEVIGTSFRGFDVLCAATACDDDAAATFLVG